MLQITFITACQGRFLGDELLNRKCSFRRKSHLKESWRESFQASGSFLRISSVLPSLLWFCMVASCYWVWVHENFIVLLSPGWVKLPLCWGKNQCWPPLWKHFKTCPFNFLSTLSPPAPFTPHNFLLLLANTGRANLTSPTCSLTQPVLLSSHSCALANIH